MLALNNLQLLVDPADLLLVLQYLIVDEGILILGGLLVEYASVVLEQFVV